jgi:hypothetical protein
MCTGRMIIAYLMHLMHSRLFFHCLTVKVKSY